MKPPLFWTNPPDQPGLLAKLLTPVSRLYEWVGARRITQAAPTHLNVPVICVGNVNLGGTGKTPTVIALLQILSDMGVSAHVVTRGYKGKLDGPVLVQERVHSANDVGDEPLLLAAFAPVWVSKDRVAGALAATAAGAELVILDDGLQNPSLEKDYSFMVVDTVAKFGNARVFPAGPLREPVQSGLKRSDMVIAIGPKSEGEDWQFDPVPVVHAALKPLQTGMDWQDMRVLAFAGIGRPTKFFDTLTELGADLVQTHSLGDHEKLPDSLLARLEREAASLGAQLVTTEKDAVRLPKNWRQKVLTLPVRLEFEASEQIKAALTDLINR